MTRTTQKVVRVITFTVIALVLVVAMMLWRDPAAALPNPNGYDDFVRAGQVVTWPLDGEGHSADYRELSLQDLRIYAATNAEALRIACAALAQPCHVPIQNTADWFRGHLGEMVTFKGLTQVFLSAARLAQLEYRTNDAVNLYLDSIRFAHESTRGGMMIHTAVSRTQEALGLEGLNSLKPTLDAAQCRRIADVLEKLDARQEPWNNYSSRELRYALRAEFKGLFSPEGWRVQRSFKKRFHQAQIQGGQAVLAFAARAYELETGIRPSRPEDLMPAYLKTFPQDPITGKALVLPP